jgi:general secretion pathway protein G
LLKEKKSMLQPEKRNARIRFGHFPVSAHPFRPINHRGFTLIELLVVMVIIGLLAALVGPRLFKNVGKSKITAAKTQIAIFMGALGQYKLDLGTFPAAEEGLQALRTKPPSAKNWEGPYLTKEVPLDPWGNPYVYKFPGEHGEEPEIVSLGADGREGGEGEDADIASWK